METHTTPHHERAMVPLIETGAFLGHEDIHGVMERHKTPHHERAIVPLIETGAFLGHEDIHGVMETHKIPHHERAKVSNRSWSSCWHSFLGHEGIDGVMETHITPHHERAMVPLIETGAFLGHEDTQTSSPRNGHGLSNRIKDCVDIALFVIEKV